MSALDLINALAPRRRVRFVGGLAYGGGPRNQADIYVPEGSLGPAPVRPPGVVFYYGGGWESGARSDYRFVAAALAARGVLVVLPDYRLHPEVDYRGFLADAAAAFVWARGVTAAHGGDPRRMVAMGHSAGAYIAAMLALDPRWLGAARPDGVIGLAGPYDFVPDTDVLRAVFPVDDPAKRSMPIGHVAAGAPPMLLATGTRDRSVLPGNTMRLAAALRAAGVAVTERHYRGIGHRLLVGALARPLQVAAPVLQDCLGFLRVAAP